MSGPRPVGVTLVAVIAWISGALQIVSGVFQLIPGGVSIWGALWSILLGFITIVVSIGLLRGDPSARTIVTIVFVLNIITSVFLIFAGYFWTGIWSAVLPIIGIVLLFTKRANRFFD
ncbi:hypothetical protein [Agromyces seonyuensis]|uniref:Uncharacterized protein n=1 Tax=Agromyces seonyuensis TaxID=2662446 RepID=A0A6I4P4F9_9MICO|nr:hypothetical protein [Agromyces seonyuensis]MWB99179.1 hypothetical protein [Agromyces seonyuensis]